MQSAVDDLAYLLHRSVVIIDPDVRLLYSSVHFGDEDQVRIKAVLHRGADSSAIGHVLAQGVTNWHTAGVIPADPELGFHARVCVPIRWQGSLLGMVLVMDADGTVMTSELAAINKMAMDVAPAMSIRMQRETAAGVHERTVLDLISREAVSRRRALAELADLPDLDRLAEVVVVQLGVRRSEGATPSHVETALRSAVAMPGPPGSETDLHAASSHDAVVVLRSATPLPGPVVRAHGQRMVERVTELASKRFECVAGIGSSVSGLASVVHSAVNAGLARRAAVQVLPGPVVSFDELGAYGPLLRIPQADLTLEALPDEVQKLLAVDRGRELAATIRAYLDAGCNGPLASDRLHIHQTTLYYRLGRLTELTGLDMSDGRTRLVLHLGLTMLDLIDSAR